MKKKVNTANLTTDELIMRVTSTKCNTKMLVTVLSIALIVAAVPFLSHLKCGFSDFGADEEFFVMSNSIASASDSKKDLISIPAGTVKANPFLPYRNIGENSVKNSLPAFELIAPPEIISEDSDAARVMDTTVSGILYDKYSPSAILNIEGNDYLVKKGDIVNNYKVIDISQNTVTVKLGTNTYKAGIGEILTEGSVTVNEVSNLNNKFGGKK